MQKLRPFNHKVTGRSASSGCNMISAGSGIRYRLMPFTAKDVDYSVENNHLAVGSHTAV